MGALGVGIEGIFLKIDEKLVSRPDLVVGGVEA